jgi:CheY-like chemotaxis protein
MSEECKDHESPAVMDAAHPGRRRGPGVLLAGDTGLLLTLLKLELKPRGVAVWLALNGHDAIDIYGRYREAIDLVLLDVQTPDPDGPQTLAALQAINPNVFACFMTGYSAAYTEEELLKRGAACVFYKPFRPDAVAHFLWLLLTACDSTPSSVSTIFVSDWQTPAEKERNPCVCPDNLTVRHSWRPSAR